MDNEEKPYRDVAYCPHCGNHAPQRFIGTHSRLADPKEETAYYTLVACETCDRGLLYVSGYVKPTPAMFYGGGFSLKDKQLVWPNAGTLHESVPDAVRACYEEAAGIKGRSPNGFANQIRRALEALCQDRGATNRTLAENIRELASRGEIPPVLSEMTDLLRILGNIGSHAAAQTVEPEHVDAIDEFFRAVVEYVYVAPYRVNEVKKQLDRL